MSARALTEAPATSSWAPLRLPVFRALWLATLASNIGTWMHDVGAGWLMTTLSPSATMVALVQTATTLPVFLLALPAGALADIVDRRRYLIAVQASLAVVAALLGVLVLSGNVSAWLLVAMTFAMGIGAALTMPAWASVTPEVVPRPMLQSAIALNSLGVNVARAIGPVVAGVIISMAGTAAVFLVNAVSFLGVVYVLLRWRRQPSVTQLPRERFLAALRSGYRFTRHASALRAATIRGAAFFLFSSATWALLPLIAREVVGGGPEVFGLLVAGIGAGAVAGAVVLPKLRQRVSRDVLVALGSALFAAAMLAQSLTGELIVHGVAMVAAGIAWITVLSSLQIAAQMALPDWVRSRGLAVFMMVFMGAMALGSLAWGWVADLYSVQLTLAIAAVGLLLAILIAWRWKISGFEDVDHTPSMHWPVPVVGDEVTHDRGPVLVTVAYDVQAGRTVEFLRAVHELGTSRRRDGAYFWNVFEHTEQPGRYFEVFCVESWLDHLRQHERVTEADRIVQERLTMLLEEGARPVVTHYVGARES